MFFFCFLQFQCSIKNSVWRAVWVIHTTHTRAHTQTHRHTLTHGMLTTAIVIYLSIQNFFLLSQTLNANKKAMQRASVSLQSIEHKHTHTLTRAQLSEEAPKQYWIEGIYILCTFIYNICIYILIFFCKICFFRAITAHASILFIFLCCDY